MIGARTCGVSSIPADTLRDAEAAGRDAARASGIDLRQLTTLEEFDACLRLYDEVWHTGPTNPPATRELLRALTTSGNYVVGAFDDDSGMVGAAFALFCPPHQRGMHSHIAGVVSQARRRGLGFAMKAHQRAWALAREVTSISWTFDPLVRRNAHFNLVKLRATPSTYLTNFYGAMADQINAAGDSDRLLVVWDLLSPAVAEACRKTGSPSGAHGSIRQATGHTVGVGLSASQRPVAGRLDGPITTIAVPRDIEAMRVSDPHLAGEWRTVVRDSLGSLLAAGARIVGFDDEVGYVVSVGGPSPS